MSSATLGKPVMAVDQQYPALRPVAGALARRDWPAMLDHLATIEPHLRFAAVRIAGEGIDDAGVAELEALAGQGRATAAMVAAAASIELGWKARTAYPR